ncbi:MAG: hypothetical protein GXO77_09825 [Calditrichaeota bacterium]|nr:hypothetical protein [Calditrichota bacterium]
MRTYFLTMNGQYKFTTLIAIFITLLLFASCKKTSTGISTPKDQLPLLNPDEYRNIVLQLIDYDVVKITHQAGLDLSSPSVYQIEVGTKIGNSFRRLAAYPSTTDTSAQTYIIRFDFTVAMDSSKIEQPLTVRYHLNDSTFIDVDTVVALYKYPYESAEVFVDSTKIKWGIYQDIARTGSKFFFHGWGDGLFEYDLVTRQTTEIYKYYGGSHIAADSQYVFCDIDHKQVVRFNLATNTPDLTLSFKNIYSIDGLAIENQSLYVLIAAQPFHLKRFTLDGVLQDSIPYPYRGSYFMAIHDSILYSKDEYHNNQITRFNLRTGNFLPNILSPARRVEGIKVYRDTLYFCNEWKKFVGVVPIADLIPVQSVEKKARRSTHLFRTH